MKWEYSCGIYFLYIRYISPTGHDYEQCLETFIDFYRQNNVTMQQLHHVTLALALAASTGEIGTGGPLC